MDTGGLAQMTFNGFSSNGLGVPGSGFASRNRNTNNSKRLSLALPPKVNSISEHQADPNPTPRTSRAHMLSGLRTQPKTPAAPASAPYDQNQYQYQTQDNQYGENGMYNAYMQGVPQTATGSGYSGAQYSGNNSRHSQMFTMPEQVLAPPTFYSGQDSDMDPSVMEQLQLTSYFLAERQRQLQQQLASITAAAQVQAQFQGLNLGQFQQGPMTPISPQNGYGQQQQKAQSPMEVPGQPGLFAVYNPMTGQYQYMVDSGSQQQTSLGYNNGNTADKSSDYSQRAPAFRAEISPPPSERPTPNTSRSITPPKKTPSPTSNLAHVEPLPPPSANAFRRGHKKASSLAINPMNGALSDGPKTAAVNGSARSVFPPTPMTGGFGPGAARAGEHPIRQPRNPPNLEELVAAPTAKHEGSKNFATRQRRAALTNLMRAGSVRRAVSGSSRSSPVSERELTFRADLDDSTYRKQSPIGFERHAQKGSNGSLEGLGAYGSAVQTPNSEKSQSDAFDMSNFVRQLPSPIQQGQERRRNMLGGLMSAAEKRRTIF
ncbi:hypothetical protein AAFC00_004906 [Neodothiora populina]|uniref:Uncharacterized protein n=1 Tax=Neodothiora populina TaxID=2781224 RepID=A0ABR3P3V6_9PEZI